MAKPGDTMELRIADLAFDGQAVAKNPDGKVIFLNGGLPGELVEARITQNKRRFDKAKLLRVIERSELRIAPICRHFERCGGCAWQDLEYQQQLAFKQTQVEETLKRLGHLEDVIVKPIVGSADRFFYRNKMEFSFHRGENEAFTLGLHERGRFDRIFDVATCHLQSEASNRLIRWLRDYVARHSLPVYDVEEHTGFMRFLMIREGKATDQIMVNLVTNFGVFPDAGHLVEELLAVDPRIVTVVHNQNGQKSNIATGEVETVLYGPGYIEDEIAGLRFRLRANAFFQTNTHQAERLYRIGFDLLQAQPPERILDLYCGTGTIGLLLAGRVASVVGVELVPDAILAARENAELNGITNVEFVQSDAKEYLRQLPDDHGFDAMVVDPPRAGMHPKALKRIIAMRPGRLLYISCNPATFARDAASLTASGYSLGEVQPVDMFPHTRHIELAAVFCVN